MIGHDAMPGHRDSQSSACPDDPRIVQAVHEYMQALDHGESPSREEFLSRYPDVAEALDNCLQGLEFVHQAMQGDERRDATGLEADAKADSAHEQLPLGDFRILRELGRGGMGVVYEALQLSLGRRVALKVLPFAAALDPVHLQRFKHEAQAAAQLHHTNIVPIYAVGAARGVHFYAMQLIEGSSLSALIDHLREHAGTSDPASSADTAGRDLKSETSVRTSTVLSADSLHLSRYFRGVARLIQQAAAALDHAHSFGVIHRDIKPANLLVDERGNIWITDFGLAQAADTQLTRTGDLLGTLRYMSPEQAAGDRAVLDHRTDIYSLGVTLYELLTLEPAVAGGDRPVLMRQIFDGEPRAPRAIDKTIPVALETIVLKAIAKAPTERYATAQQFADDLDRWLDDKPILARRPSIWERAARWRRRHRALVASSFVVVLLLSLGLLASTILILREHARTKDAWRREIGHREAAEENFRQAREAVDSFALLAEEELANSPETFLLRRKILHEAVQYYEGFLKQRRDDPAVRDQLAGTSRRIAQISDELAVLEGFAPLMLLSHESVLKELALSSEQSQKIQIHLAQLRDDRLQNEESEDPLPLMARRQRLVALLRVHQQEIERLLDSRQRQRLRQIAWQARRPFTFKFPEIIAALKLTPQQRQQISEIMEEENPMSHGPGPGEVADRTHDPRDVFPDGRPRARHAVRGAIDRTVDRIVWEALNDEQRARWHELVGEPFAYDLRWHPHDWVPR